MEPVLEFYLNYLTAKQERSENAMEPLKYIVWLLTTPILFFACLSFFPFIHATLPTDCVS